MTRLDLENFVFETPICPYHRQSILGLEYSLRTTIFRFDKTKVEAYLTIFIVIVPSFTSSEDLKRLIIGYHQQEFLAKVYNKYKNTVRSERRSIFIALIDQLYRKIAKKIIEDWRRAELSTFPRYPYTALVTKKFII